MPKKRVIAVAVAVALGAPALEASAQSIAPTTLPTGGKVVAGQASIAQSGASMTVHQSTSRAALDWQSFNIGSQASVRFDQPSASSIALNQILGNNASQIYGSLTANGQVFLLNPNGVLFGRGAQIDVGGLLASTLRMSVDDFMGGRNRLTASGGSGSIVNEGSIKAAPKGYVAFVGPTLRNDGTIETPSGTVSLTAANAATLEYMADGLVRIRVDQRAVESEVTNNGVITGEGVYLNATAMDSLARAVVNNTGVIEARTVESVNGVVRLGGGKVELAGNTVFVDGRVDASGAEGKGGSIKVLGDKVALVGRAELDASGDKGGGEVLVGGNYQGKGTEQNASYAYVGKDVAIDASAGTQGDGGKVIVWSNEGTQFHGRIAARGGVQSGNGGFVETSGGTLAVTGRVDTSAPKGQVGKWLLDPTNLKVADAPGVDVVTTASINTAISDVTLEADNDITFENSVSIAAANVALSAEAGRSIIINPSVSIVTNSGNVTLTANSETPSIPGNRQSGAGGITMGAGSFIDASNGGLIDGGQGGTISLRVGQGSVSAADQTSGNIVVENLLANNVSIIHDGLTANSSILRASASSLIAANAVFMELEFATGAAASIGTASEPIRVDALNLEAHYHNASGGIFIDSIADLEIGGVPFFAGSVRGVQAVGGGDVQITVNGNLTQLAGAAGCGLTGGTGGPICAPGGDVTLTATGSIGITNVVSASNMLSLNAGTGIAATGIGAVEANQLVFASGAGHVDLLGNNLVGTLAGTAGGHVYFHNANDLTIGTVNGVDGITTTANGGSGTDVFMTVAGDLTLLQPINTGSFTNPGGSAYTSVKLHVDGDIAGGASISTGNASGMDAESAIAVRASYSSPTMPGNVSVGDLTTGTATSSNGSADSGVVVDAPTGTVTTGNVTTGLANATGGDANAFIVLDSSGLLTVNGLLSTGGALGGLSDASVSADSDSAGVNISGSVTTGSATGTGAYSAVDLYAGGGDVSVGNISTGAAMATGSELALSLVAISGENVTTGNITTGAAQATSPSAFQADSSVLITAGSLLSTGAIQTGNATNAGSDDAYSSVFLSTAGSVTVTGNVSTGNATNGYSADSSIYIEGTSGNVQITGSVTSGQASATLDNARSEIELHAWGADLNVGGGIQTGPASAALLASSLADMSAAGNLTVGAVTTGTANSGSVAASWVALVHTGFAGGTTISAGPVTTGNAQVSSAGFASTRVDVFDSDGTPAAVSLGTIATGNATTASGGTGDTSISISGIGDITTSAMTTGTPTGASGAAVSIATSAGDVSLNGAITVNAGAGRALVDVAATGDINIGANISTNGGGTLDQTTQPSGVRLLAGNRIVNTGGILSVIRSDLTGDVYVELEAQNGIGTLADPIRMQDTSILPPVGPVVLARNLGTSGDLAFSIAFDGGTISIDDGLPSFLNNNPDGTYFFRVENGNLAVNNVQLLPNGLPLFGNQSVELSTPQGSITFGSGAGVQVFGTGTITLNASNTGAGGGVFQQTGSSLSTQSGAITITGAATGGAGVMIGGNVTTTGGDISIAGSVSGAASQPAAFLIGGANLQTLDGGLITITGTNTGTGGGVSLSSGTSVQASGWGNVSITGTGGTNGTGVFLGGLINANGGSITIDGTGGTTSGSLSVAGVVANAAMISAANTVTITGTGGTSTNAANNTPASGVGLNSVTVQGDQVSITGYGGTSAGGGAAGIVLTSSAASADSDINAASSITIYGEGGSGAGSSGGSALGVIVGGMNDLSITHVSTAGTIDITGFGGTGTNTSATGVALNHALVESLGGITITGTAGTATTSINAAASATGISIVNSTVQTADFGHITLTGTAGSSAGTGNATGVALSDGAVISTQGIDIPDMGGFHVGFGTVTIDGTGGNSSAGTGGANGVVMSHFNTTNGASILTASGSVIITGNAGTADTGEARGVAMRSNGGTISMIESTDGGTIDISGYGGTASSTGPSSVVGVGAAAAARIRGNGFITIHGEGGVNNGTTGANGVGFSDGATIEALASGWIDVTGFGGTATNGGSAFGVTLQPFEVSSVTGGSIVSDSGTITVHGTGGSVTGAGAARGVMLQNALIQSTSGTINVIGDGGTVQAGGTGSATGVGIGGSTLSTSSDLSITGTGGINNGSGPAGGVSVVNGSLVQTTGSGNLFITGTGGSVNTGPATGIFVGPDATTMGATLATDSGTMTLQGVAGTPTPQSMAMRFVNADVHTTSGNMTLTATGDITVVAVDSQSQLSAGGYQSITSDGTLSLQGGASGSGRFAGIVSNGGQWIDAAGITVTGGADGGYDPVTLTGVGNGAFIRNNAFAQDITVGATGLHLTGGGGSLTDNAASVSSGGTQTIIVDSGGSIVLQGGSSAGTNVGGVGHGSIAAISATDSQWISFTAGGALNLTGGTNGSRNIAVVTTTNGPQTITGSPTITLIGGASGGISGEENQAVITTPNGSQWIESGNMTLVGGAGASGVNYSGINAPSQTITVHGDLAISGDAAGPARIGGFGHPATPPSATNLQLNVDGDVTLTGGSVATAGARIGSNGQGLLDTNIAMTVGGSVTLQADVAPVWIGSPSTNTAAGDIFIDAAGGLALVGNASQTAAIRTNGLIWLSGGHTIVQDAVIHAGDTLTVNVHGLSVSAPTGLSSTVESGLDQFVTAGAGGIHVTGGAGGAQIITTGGGNQSFLVNDGGSVVLHAGTGTNAFARIVNDFGGTPSQQFTFTAGGAIELAGGGGGSGNFARIASGGWQAISEPTQISLYGGTGGGGIGTSNHAQIWSGAGQSIAASGIQLIGGGGALTNNSATIVQNGGAGTSQSIVITGGGSLVLQGGNSAQQNVGAGNGSYAAISSNGDWQQIHFTDGGLLALTGGDTGSRNFASISGATPSTHQSIIGLPAVTLTGGAGGGVTGEGNFATISTPGTQQLHLGTTTLNGGNAGTDSFAGIFGAIQDVFVTGDLTLNGGAATVGGVRIGAMSGTDTDLVLSVDGSIAMQGQTGGTTIGSNRNAGGAATLDISTTGSITLTASVTGARIGTSDLAPAGGDVSINAGGALSLNGNATTGTAIRTLGNLTIGADSINVADSIITSGSGPATTQSITVTNGLVVNANANASSIQSNAAQFISAGSITVDGGIVTGKGAFISASNGNQTISASGSVTLTGGTAAGASGAGCSLSGGSCAQINLNGAGALQTIIADGVVVQGGSAGTANGAGIFISGGADQQLIVGGGGLAVLGGAGGQENNATLGGGSANGRSIDIFVDGNTTLTGGPGTNSTAFIGLGGTGDGGAITINLTGTGSLTLTAGSGTNAIAGIGAGGMQTNATSDVTIVATHITLNDSTSTISRIGHSATANGPGTISVTATSADIALNSANGIGSTIRTTGDVSLNAAGAITGGGTSVVGANTLTANADNGIALLGNNVVTTLNASNTTANGIQFQQAATAGPLTIGGIGQSGGDVTITADDLSITGPVFAGTSNVVLRPLTLTRDISIQSSDVPGVFTLSASDLANIFAGTLEIGRLDGSGALTVNPIAGVLGDGMSVDTLRLLGRQIDITGADIGSPFAPFNANFEARATDNLTIGRFARLADGRSMTLVADNNADHIGDLRLSDGANVNVGGGPGNTGSMTLSGENVIIGGGAMQATARVEGTGSQTITAANSFQLIGGTAADQSVHVFTVGGTQTISADSILVLGGGTNAAANLQSGGDQIITSANGFSILSGSGPNASAWVTAGTGQTVNAGYLEIVAQNGSFASLSNHGGSQSVTTTGMNGSTEGIAVTTLATGGQAEIFNHGAGAQTISVNNAELVRVAARNGMAHIIANGSSQTITLQGAGFNALEIGSGDGLDAGGSNITGANQDVSAGSITIRGQQTNFFNSIQATSGTQNVDATGNIALFGGTSATGSGASIVNMSGGGQSVTAHGIIIQGGASGSQNRASLFSMGDQNVTAGVGGITLMGGAGDSQNSANISQQNSGNQSVTVNGGSLLIAGGSGAGTQNNASIFQSNNAAGTQTVTVNGGNITLQGGTVGTQNSATIASQGASQTVHFGSGGTLQITGGSSGADNWAGIETQTGNMTISGAPDIVMAGGSGGGAPDQPNSADVFAEVGLLTITANNLSLTGGAGTEAAAVIGGSTVDISANVVTIQGGSGTGAVAGIVNADGAVVSITLDAANLTMIGGSGGVGSFGLAGDAIIGAKDFDADVTLNLTGGMSASKGASSGFGSIIGSDTGGGSIAINTGTTLFFDGGIRTTGGVTLNSGGGVDFNGASVQAGSLAIMGSGSTQILGGTTTFQTATPFTNTGTLAVLPGATLSTANTNMVNAATGLIVGSGTIDVGTGTLMNDGAVQPGGPASVGTLTVVGNYAQGATGSLTMDLASNSSYDVLSISNAATLGGVLNVNYLGGYAPFGIHNIITYASRAGTFATINDPHALSAIYGSTVFSVGDAFNTWVSLTGGDWATGSNWSFGHAPTSNEDARVPELAGTQTITFSGSVQAARSLLFLGDEQFSLTGGSLTLSNSSSLANGTLAIGGATLVADGGLTVKHFVLSSGSLSGAGDVTVTDSYTRTGGTFSIGGIASITQLSGALALGTVGASALGATALSGGITGTTSVGTLAASASGPVSIFNTAPGGTLTIGSVGSTNGVSGTGVAITETAGHLSILQPVNGGASGVFIAASGAERMITNASTVTGLGGVTLSADKMSLAAGSVNAGSSLAALYASSLNANVDVGSTTDAQAATLELSAAETATVTAGTLQIGRIESTGTLNLTTSLNNTDINAGTLRLVAGDVNVSGFAGFAFGFDHHVEMLANNNLSLGSFTLADNRNLTLTADRDLNQSGDVLLSGSIQVGTSAANTGSMTVAGENINVLATGSVDVNALVNGSGAQTFTARNNITFDNSGQGVLAVGTQTGAQTLTATTGRIEVVSGVGPNGNASVGTNGGNQVVTAGTDVIVRNRSGAGPTSHAGLDLPSGGSQTINAQRVEVTANGGAHAGIWIGAGSGSQTINTTGAGVLVQSTAAGGEAFIQTSGTGPQAINVAGPGNVTVVGGAGSARIAGFNGAQSLQVAGTIDVGGNTASGTSTIQGGAGLQDIHANQLIVLGGNATNSAGAIQTGGAQNVVVGGGGVIMEGGSAAGGGASASIFASGAQTVTVNGGDVALLGGTNGLNQANISSAAAQNFTVNNGDFVSLLAQAGQAGLSATGVQTVILQGTGANALLMGGAGATNGSFLSGQSQTITAGMSGQSGSITLLGGSGIGKGASIFTNGGTQTVSTAGSITMIGGTAAGAAGAGCGPTGGSCATINKNGAGAQTVTANAIFMQGGSSGSGNGAGMFVNGGPQTISAGLGGLTMLGGGAGSENGANIGGANVSGQTITVNVAGNTTITGGAAGSSAAFIGLGGTGSNNSVTVNFSGTGNLVMTAGTGTNSIAGIGAAGTQTNATSTVTVTAADISLNDSASTVSRIGHSGTANGPGNLSVTATAGNIALNSLNGMGSAIRTTGNVALTASGAITEGAASVVGAASLVTSSGSGTSLTGNNAVNSVTSANTGAGNISLTNTSPLLTVAAMTTSGAGNVTLNNAGSVNVAGAVGGAGTTTITATGSIAGAGLISGANVALDSATGIGVSPAARVSTAAGTLAARATTSGSVFISEANAVTLATVNGVSNGVLTSNTYDLVAGGNITLQDQLSAGNLALASSGAIANVAGASINVLNNASLTGTSINLGNQSGDAVNFGSVTYNSAGNVSVAEDSAMVVTGTNTAGGLALAANGSLADASGASQTITGNATYAGGSITLADNAADVLSVGGTATFNAGAGAVSIPSAGTANFGSLAFTATGAVSITEDSATQLAGASTAGSLTLASAGALTNAASASLTVTNNASFSGTSINLGNQSGDAMNFGSLTFNTAGAVSIAEDSAMQLAGVNTAGSLILGSAGAIANAPSASLGVTGNANLTGTSIDLGNQSGDAVNLGSLTYSSTGAVSVSTDSALAVTGSNSANSLTLVSTGAMTDAAGTSQVISGNATFTGAGITLADNASDVLSVGGTATFNAGGGALSIPAAGTANFGSLAFTTTGAVSIAEDSATQLAGASTAGSVTLASAGALTNAASATLAVTGNANLTGTSINLGNQSGDTVNFGSLTYNSAGAVAISEDSAMAITGTNTAGSLALNALGAITEIGTSQVIGGNAAYTGTSITLVDSPGDVLSVGGTSSFTATSGSVSVNAGGVALPADTTFTLAVSATGPSGITIFTSGTLIPASINAGASTVVLDAASLAAGGPITASSATLGSNTSVSGVNLNVSTLTLAGSATNWNFLTDNPPTVTNTGLNVTFTPITVVAPPPPIFVDISTTITSTSGAGTSTSSSTTTTSPTTTFSTTLAPDAASPVQIVAAPASSSAAADTSTGAASQSSTPAAEAQPQPQAQKESTGGTQQTAMLQRTAPTSAASRPLTQAAAALVAATNELREQKASALQSAVSILESNPAAADLRTCEAGKVADNCIAMRPAKPRSVATRKPAEATLPQIQRKVALLIGVNDYRGGIPKLDSPLKDIQEIGKMYREQFGYEVRMLPNADKASIVRALNRLIMESGPNDSVTVFYAGHGQLVDKTGRGYWIPARASADDPTQWISNQDIGRALENIPAKQVLLVSDSCYSGTLTRDAKVRRAEVLPDPAAVLERRSVTVLSSGGEEPVADAGRDGHSVFAWHFMQTLRGVEKWSNGVDVYERLTGNVLNDFPQEPQYGEAAGSGHERGGDYLFEVRKY